MALSTIRWHSLKRRMISSVPRPVMAYWSRTPSTAWGERGAQSVTMTMTMSSTPSPQSSSSQRALAVGKIGQSQSQVRGGKNPRETDWKSFLTSTCIIVINSATMTATSQSDRTDHDGCADQHHWIACQLHLSHNQHTATCGHPIAWLFSPPWKRILNLII